MLQEISLGTVKVKTVRFEDFIVSYGKNDKENYKNGIN